MRRETATKLLVAASVAAGLAGCGNSAAEFMRAPRLSPVGSGMVSQADYGERPEPLPIHIPDRSGGTLGNLYTDQRIAKVGDIVTVVISINDKATFGNATGRSTTAKTTFGLDWQFTPASSSSSGSQGSPGTLTNDINSTSASQGQGTIDRSEQIQFSVPAVVTQVLPNGNLLIRGSQEVRVNFELRQLSVAGIVRPSDISRNNTIAYDRVAEARISYGGRGRISEVQQPSWGQQVYDYARPF
jgi:flagellar L-ring protein precursor FlgH